MVVKEKLLDSLDIQIEELRSEKLKCSSSSARCKYNSMIGLVQNLFKDIDEGKFD